MDQPSLGVDFDARYLDLFGRYNLLRGRAVESNPRCALFKGIQITDVAGVEGLQQNAPTARFGHISQMPGDPMETDTGKIQEEAFLCEVRSIGGYSGSPVFVLPNPTYSREGEPFPKDTGILLGVDFCHVPNWTPAYDGNGLEMSHIKVPLNSGMAGVIPGWRVLELLMSEALVNQRKHAEKQELQRRNAPKAISDAAEAGPLE